MSRHARWFLALIGFASAAAGQSAPPQTIDIKVPAPTATDEASYGDCTQAEKDVATISGEILVCRRRNDESQHRLDSRENAERRYAEETMHAGDPQSPDVAGPGIFRGPPTFSGICGIGLNPCPAPPAYLIDFSTLPDAPPGSDADRIARGLPPLGNDGAAVSSAESASPAAEPAG